MEVRMSKNKMTVKLLKKELRPLQAAKDVLDMLAKIDPYVCYDDYLGVLSRISQDGEYSPSPAMVPDDKPDPVRDAQEEAAAKFF